LYCFPLFQYWNRGFEFHSGNGYMSAVYFVLSCVYTGNGLIPHPRSLTTCLSITILRN
jgi:hypothetical protein